MKLQCKSSFDTSNKQCTNTNSHVCIYEFLKSIGSSNIDKIRFTSYIDYSIRSYLIFLNSLNFTREIFSRLPETFIYTVKSFIENLGSLLELILSDSVYSNFEINYLLV